MDMTALLLETEAAPGAPALLLRPWRPSDASVLAELYRDGALRRWASAGVDGMGGAERWLEEQRRGWQRGDRFAFAVVEPVGEAGDGQVVGNAVLKNVSPGAPAAEVGYWTAAHARGRAVAPRALRAVTDWAFATFGDGGLTRLDLLHQIDNVASCRVAEKTGYAFSALLPASPPAFPLDGHLHMRTVH
ncbi:GNAT family N-acetyltransferase [Streptomyces sp. S.PNR 29]|uniref:GNAT family N-acetyltransferase n=1 Tax=Streptomyces sp. S.PNR 29 TaxID=2973805 RepID=UPI0025B10969|nr:GNAT family N-acetyltransferase [Streptomyces sp. S.PNR 29]MDN0200203.1 GNAT family N-acetyltransferase [Streptomyces sp. S.PNR 29]